MSCAKSIKAFKKKDFSKIEQKCGSTGGEVKSPPLSLFSERALFRPLVFGRQSRQINRSINLNE